MDRRGFLKGVFGGVTAAGVIVAASPADVEAFAAPLLREAPVVLDVSSRPQAAMITAGEHLYNARGDLVAIVSEVTVWRASGDVTAAGDHQRWVRPDRLVVDIRAAGVAGLQRFSGRP